MYRISVLLAFLFGVLCIISLNGFRCSAEVPHYRPTEDAHFYRTQKNVEASTDQSVQGSIVYVSDKVPVFESIAMSGCIGYDWDGMGVVCVEKWTPYNLFGCDAVDTPQFVCPISIPLGMTLFFNLEYAPTIPNTMPTASFVCNSSGLFPGISVSTTVGKFGQLLCEADKVGVYQFSITTQGDISAEHGGYICNGSFEQGVGCWSYASDNSNSVFSLDCNDAYDGICGASIVIDSSEEENCQIKTNVQVWAKKKYELVFAARSESAAELRVTLEDNEGVGMINGLDTIVFTNSDWNEYVVKFVPSQSDEEAFLVFSLSGTKNAVLIDSISLKGDYQ